MVNTSAVGPSALPWKHPALGTVTPRALTLEEIQDIKQRFVHAAKICKQCGFDGVQLHSAHGYLLSSFLNPRANARTDDYGGSLENRARLLLETVRSVRAAVGDKFPIGVKINSADFQQGGFSLEECAQVAQWLDAEGLDLLELSGGNYENTEFLNGDNANNLCKVFERKNESTKKREAYFLQFAKLIRNSMEKTPIMVTGGIRSRATMEEALASGDCEVIGIGRPLCGMPDASGKLLAGFIDEMPRWETELNLPMLLLPLMLTTLGPKMKMLAQQMWYYNQLRSLAAGHSVNLRLGLIWAVLTSTNQDATQAASLKGLTCKGEFTNTPRSSLGFACTIVTMLNGVVVQHFRRLKA
eukprot:TRINITY_DN14851_c0_g1_i1.p1 TRINITY_DN14851_c0_g1~~TRINITY_DN14851_c0_g1_i1.p1  ORF type:complete len:356 (+),score=73.48 TRINITY_DN14851_c0_g1_i1:472-1539(+)